MAEFLGQGWKFPIRVNGRGGLGYVSGERAVAEAIWIILSTPRKSRIMEPAFGCGIHDYVFAPNNANTRAIIETEVRAALTTWEPRIDVLSVAATAHLDAPNTLLIEVDYRLRANNAAGNLVYPFFINEGLA
ncbi:GPW/gp25 family protein [Fluviibacterium sp. DFM31]|uniref:GPW/gp25 family protein n=1 Tax=Meridianimarinicoccus marinus TaxID=3231483 RepID=A0ABV3L8V8_9RHOB